MKQFVHRSHAVSRRIIITFNELMRNDWPYSLSARVHPSGSKNNACNVGVELSRLFFSIPDRSQLEGYCVLYVHRLYQLHASWIRKPRDRSSSRSFKHGVSRISVLPEGGTLFGFQCMNLYHILLRCLTRSGQLPPLEALVVPATEEVVSQMTPENVVEEVFWILPT